MGKRNKKENRSKAGSRYHDIKIGDQTFVVNACKILKTDPKYLGPYTVDETLTRYRVRLIKDSLGESEQESFM